MAPSLSELGEPQATSILAPGFRTCSGLPCLLLPPHFPGLNSQNISTLHSLTGCNSSTSDKRSLQIQWLERHFRCQSKNQATLWKMNGRIMLLLNYFSSSEVAGFNMSSFQSCQKSSPSLFPLFYHTCLCTHTYTRTHVCARAHTHTHTSPPYNNEKNYQHIT